LKELENRLWRTGTDCETDAETELDPPGGDDEVGESGANAPNANGLADPGNDPGFEIMDDPVNVLGEGAPAETGRPPVASENEDEKDL
jgi:hypothetical protein